MTVAIVTGTRPEIIKMYPIMRLFDERDIDYKFIHTGQHYDQELFTQFIQEFKIRNPDYNITLTSISDPVGQFSEIMSQLNIVLKKFNPSMMLVVGDTNSVAASALVAIKSKILLAHVESGLRSYDWKTPEEHNRRMVDHISDILFTPTLESSNNLEVENIRGYISVVGNTVIDAVKMQFQMYEKYTDNLIRTYPGGAEKDSDFVLVTLHRAENVDDQDFLRHTLMGLSESNQRIIFPIHPRTLRRIHEFGLDNLIKQNIKVIEPVGYFKFLKLLQMCKFIITDSGGIQEEITSPRINKRALILRNSTERPESIQSGHTTLWKGHYNHILLSETIHKIANTKRKLEIKCPYGAGDAAEKIVKIIEDMNITEIRKVKAQINNEH